MRRFKNWVMDEQDRAMEIWLMQHPGKTEEDAWYALYDQGQPEPDFEERAVPKP